MGKYRDHREPRWHRYDDDPVSFSERTSEPSYFQRPPPVTADPVDAEVLWFTVSKGFGFVKLSDGTEAYLHVRVLEAAGSRDVAVGTPLKITVEKSPKGHQVAQVLEIGDHRSKTPSHTRVAGGTFVETGAQLESGARSSGTNPKRAAASLLLTTVRRTSSFMPAP
ncbi:cold shock domain-containing protein [Mesorhizobium sp. M0894]|uniref:cold-shock protein n=1 Tax=unclassified Mesorhizobium TaxID=325217 RepID=UPI00333B5825